MKAETRIFGTIDIADEKIVTMEKGMIGFPELKHFALIFDEEKEKKDRLIMWFQSMDDGDIAFPVMEPSQALEEYAPEFSEEMLSVLGEMKDEDVFLLVTVTVPREVEKLTCNLQAPIIINMSNNKGAQVIVENDYPIKYSLAHLIKNKKEKAGE